MVDEFKDTLTCPKNIILSDGTRKRVGTEVSDSSTSDEESIKNTSNTSTDNWLRFLIIEGVLNSLSPFTIH